MSSIEKFLAVLVLFISTISAMGFYIMQHKMDVAERSSQLYLSQIEQQNMAIDSLERNSEIQINLQKKRDEQAKADADTYAKEIRELMRAEVPNDCSEAMHWMILESQNMRPR